MCLLNTLALFATSSISDWIGLLLSFFLFKAVFKQVKSALSIAQIAKSRGDVEEEISHQIKRKTVEI
jgi:cystathionine beta-lyase/cystathionine gamma-synthase